MPLIILFATLLRDTWNEKRSPLLRSESLIESIFKQEICNDSCTRDGSSSFPIISKTSASVLPLPVTSVRESNVRDFFRVEGASTRFLFFDGYLKLATASSPDNLNLPRFEKCAVDLACPIVSFSAIHEQCMLQ